MCVKESIGVSKLENFLYLHFYVWAHKNEKSLKKDNHSLIEIKERILI